MAAIATLRSGRHSQRRKELGRPLKGLAFCSPWIIGFLAFGVIPILASFYFSFNDYSILQPPRWAGADNYTKLLFEDRLFRVALGNTLYYTVVANLVGGTIALGLAFLLNMKVAGLAW